MQDLIVGIIAAVALGIIAWRVIRANRAASSATPQCPSCPGYKESVHGPARTRKA